MAKKVRRTGRGSNMGNDYQRAKDARDVGKKWLTIPNGWQLFSEEEDTTYYMDFLPYVVKDVKNHPEGQSMTDDVWYRFPYRVHRNVGPQKIDYICPETFGLPCPRCEKVREIYNNTSLNKKKQKALASKYYASRRSLYIVKVIGGQGDGWDKKIKNKKFIFDQSDHLFFKLLDKEIGLNDPDTKNFACLEAGYTLEVRFSSDAFEGNSYAKPDRIDFKSRKDYPAEILDKNPDLAEIVKAKLPTYEELVAADDSTGGKSGKAGDSKSTDQPSLPDDDTLDDMDFDELTDLVNKLELTSEVDPDDFDEDDGEDELRDAIKEAFDTIYGDRPTSDPDDADSPSEYPDQDTIEDMDYDELCEVCKTYDLDDIDPDDFDEDEDDEVDDFREQIINAIMNLANDSDGESDDNDLEEEIDDANNYKRLRAICKANNIFGDINFKKFKDSPEKLKKKMLKKLGGNVKASDSKKSGKADKADKGGKSGKCPYGHAFGDDWGDFDECEEGECKQYKACWKKNDKDIPF